VVAGQKFGAQNMVALEAHWLGWW